MRAHQIPLQPTTRTAERTARPAETGDVAFVEVAKKKGGEVALKKEDQHCWEKNLVVKKTFAYLKQQIANSRVTMEAIEAAISGNRQEQKVLNEEKDALSKRIMRNFEKTPSFVDVVAAFEQNPHAALEKYRPVRDRFLKYNQDESRLREIGSRLQKLFTELLEHQNTRKKITKQLAAEQRVGEFEGLNENELRDKAVGLLALFNKKHRCSDPHRDDSEDDAIRQTEARLDAVVILLKGKNVEVTFNQGTISFSGESRAGAKRCRA